MTKVTHIHLDAIGGIAGDMFVAAMLDALPHLEPSVFADIAAVLPPACGTPELTCGKSNDIAARRFSLRLPEDGKSGQEIRGSDHAHPHSHSHGHDHHPHEKSQVTEERVSHRSENHTRIETFRGLVGRIRAVSLSQGTADVALKILTRLAEAESGVHQMPLDEVHFHELADWDSLMDITGAASIIAAVGPDITWSVSELPRGNGQVQTAHGLLPVPAPAATELLRGFRWRDDKVGGERVTPTGAAILSYLIPTPSVYVGSGVLIYSGTGAGTRKLPGIPNILRVLAFDQSVRGQSEDSIIVLEFDIDDMSGEEIAVAAEHIRADQGTLDLTLGNRSGKKGRTVTDFRVMAREEAFERVRDLCLFETSTIGLRYRREARVCLPRTAETIIAGDRQLNRKRTVQPDGTILLKVESDDLANAAGLVSRRRQKFQGEQSDS